MRGKEVKKTELNNKERKNQLHRTSKLDERTTRGGDKNE